MQKETTYKSLNALEIGKYKSPMLRWIAKKFNLTYAHTFKDSFIIMSVWNGVLAVCIDARCEEQVQLLNSIPKEYIGCNQYKTGIRVNLDWMYFDIEKEFEVVYPEIVSSKIVHTEKHFDDGDTWNVYTYEILLSDNTSLIHTDHNDKLNMPDFLFKTKIQERTIYNSLIKK